MNRSASVLVAVVLALLGATAALFYGARTEAFLADVGLGLPFLALMVSLATFVLAPVPASRRPWVLVASILGGVIGAAAFLGLRQLTDGGFDDNGVWLPLDPYALATVIILAALLGTIVVRLLPEGQRPRLSLIALGTLVAIGAPVAQILVAWLWGEGVISPEPNGPFVQTLQFGFVLEWLLAPLGIYLIGVGYRLATPVRWIVLFALCSPVIAVLWFLGAASLGGLAGEPF
jgi:hypothetical protein